MMKSRLLQVENTVRFICFTVEVKAYLQILFTLDFVLGVLVLIFECVHPLFDVFNPQVSAPKLDRLCQEVLFSGSDHDHPASDDGLKRQLAPTEDMRR